MTKIALFLAQNGYVLRSGGAEGADSAFERGVRQSGFPSLMEIWLPWRGFNNRSGPTYHYKDYPHNCWEYQVSEKHHPNWGRLSDAVRKLMCRNANQVFGNCVETSSNSLFVICWTKDGLDSGGTGQAIRVAREVGIPVYNLNTDAGLLGVEELLKTIEENQINGT